MAEIWTSSCLAEISGIITPFFIWNCDKLFVKGLRFRSNLSDKSRWLSFDDPSLLKDTIFTRKNWALPMTKRNHSEYSWMLRLLSVKKSVGYLYLLKFAQCVWRHFIGFIFYMCPSDICGQFFPLVNVIPVSWFLFFSGIIFWLSNSWHISQSVIVSRWLPYLAFENLTRKKLVTPDCNISKVHLTH